MTAFVMKYEETNGVGMAVEKPRIEHYDTACRQTKVGQTRIQNRTRVRAAHRTPRHRKRTIFLHRDRRGGFQFVRRKSCAQTKCREVAARA
jgi:hypothetical protein